MQTFSHFVILGPADLVIREDRDTGHLQIAVHGPTCLEQITIDIHDLRKVTINGKETDGEEADRGTG